MSITETIPFNFEENYEFIEKKFKEKGYDLEEGSNTMQLVTAMSYLTSMLNANTAVNVNETILPLARKRKNILQDSRVLGYELEHTRSYRYNLELRLSNTTASEQTRVISRHTSFTANGLTYYYMGEGFETIVPANSTKTITIKVTEGTLLKYTDPNQQPLNLNIRGIEENGVISPQKYIDVPYTNVEDTGIEVFLTYYDEFGIFHKLEEWTRSESFMIDKDTSLQKEFVRIDDIDYGTPRIYFKIGDVGKDLRVGTIVNMNVLKSNGASGKMTEAPSPVSLDAEVLGYTLDLVGADEEANESIKKNAPLFHNTANRVITKQDYIAFCNRLAKVKSTQVWDGHDEIPKIPGHIWFSFIPSSTVRSIIPTDSTKKIYQMQNLEDTNNWYIDQNPTGSVDPDLQEIYQFLDDYKVPTLVFNHRNPVYMDFEYDVNIVKYSLAKSRADRNESVFEIIDEYFTGNNTAGDRTMERGVETYQFEYFQSNLTKRIDSELTDVTGFNISLKTSIPLYKNNIIDGENVAVYDDNGNPSSYYKEMIFHLGFPYEDIMDSIGDLVETNFPSIETPSFIGTDNLYVDLTTKTLDAFNNVAIYDIRLGAGSGVSPNALDEKIGEYKVHFGIIKTIEVVIFIETVTGHASGILETDLDITRTVEIKYPSPNLRFSRNTIPRLRQVNFV